MENPKSGSDRRGDLTRDKHVDPRSGSLAFRSTAARTHRILSQISLFPNRKAAVVELSEVRQGRVMFALPGQLQVAPGPKAAAARGACSKERTVSGKAPGSKSSPRTGKSVYLLGRTNTFAVGAKSSRVPPTISGPKGVKAIPRLSARASGVSSQSVSHRLPCTSKVKVRGEMSIGFPSAVTFLKLCGAVVPPEK